MIFKLAKCYKFGKRRHKKKQDPKKPKYKVVGKFKGSDLKGWRYVPLFEYFSEQVSSGRAISPSPRISRLTVLPPPVV